MDGTLIFIYLTTTSPSKLLTTLTTRTIKWTRTQLLLDFKLRECRRANTWNAFIKEKISEANSTRAKGERFKLPFFVAKFKEALLTEYKSLSPAEKHTLAAKLQDARRAKPPPARANPKAANHAISATFTKMDREVCSPPSFFPSF